MFLFLTSATLIAGKLTGSYEALYYRILMTSPPPLLMPDELATFDIMWLGISYGFADEPN